jgi:hypothetical protein
MSGPVKTIVTLRWRAMLQATPLRAIGFVLVIATVVARSFAVVHWPEMFFEADQAITGLMAKHLAEGRAFPVFMYGQSYVLVLEAWLIAALFLIADTSVTIVKMVPVALNVLAAALLYGILTSSLAFRPAMALVAIAPFALPGPGTASQLTDAHGMAVEPLVFALLFWCWRNQPVALGVTAGLAVKNREFALYAIAALIVVDLVRDRSPKLWRGRVVALIAFLVTWWGVEALRQFSSPNGPGTSFAMAASGGDTLAVLASAACIDASQMSRDLWVTVSELLPMEFGLTARPSFHPQPFVASWLWIPLVTTLASSTALGLWRAWRDHPTQTTWFGLYLVIIGMAAVVAYATTRCGHAAPHTFRYLLIAMLAPTGALVLGLERERPVAARLLITGVAALWTSIAALNHLAVVRAFAESTPERGYRQLATYLESRDVRFIVADYWTGYYVAFVTDERIKPLTNFDRIHDYRLAVNANRDSAVEVRPKTAPPCVNAIEAAGFLICPPITPPR